jgi:predicted transcriptional regulator
METASESAPAALERVAPLRAVDGRLELAVAMYERGASLGEVASTFEVTPQAVWRWLKKRGVQRRAPGRRPDPRVARRRVRVAAAYVERSIAELAAAEGVSSKTIETDLEVMGVPRRPQGYTRAHDAKAAAARASRAARRYTAGATLAEIAADEDVYPSTIWQDLKRHGVGRRRPGRRGRNVVGDRRPRKECARPGCTRTFVVYPCDEARRGHCSDRCEALELWRTGRISEALLITPAMRKRWKGRWTLGRLKRSGGHKKGERKARAVAAAALEVIEAKPGISRADALDVLITAFEGRESVKLEDGQRRRGRDPVYRQARARIVRALDRGFHVLGEPTALRRLLS